MGKKDHLELFKERITVTDYAALIKELSDGIDGGDSVLKKLLFGNETPDLYADHGFYQCGQHNYCAGFTFSKDRNFTEKRLCKCLYYRNTSYSKHCDNCAFPDRFHVIGDYQMIDYEVPAFYYGKGIGEIDLIISDGSIHYATEVKAYKGNSETLLRMIAEIMTYTEGYMSGQYKKAIAFFEKNRENGTKTVQQKEYENADPALKVLIKKADITVFRFEEVSEKVYRICKL